MPATKSARGYDIAIAVVIIAIGAVLAWGYFRQTPPPPLSSSDSTEPSDVPVTAMASGARAGAAESKERTQGPVPPPTRAAARVPEPAAPEAGSDCFLSPSLLRKVASEVYAQHPGASEFPAALDMAVGVDPHTRLQDRGVTVWMNDSLTIMVLFPYGTFRIGLTEALRKKESITNVQVPIGPTVVVSPSRIDAPDIEKIIVERDGQIVEPLSNLLSPQELATAMGAKRMIHAGAVLYSCSAFAPGGRVVVTAIPRFGANMVKTVSAEDLDIVR